MNLSNPSYLLDPNIPKPLHGLNPRTVLGKDWWDRERRAAYTLSNYHCYACDEKPVSNFLHGHEVYDYDYANFRASLKRVISLCPKCHHFIHSGRMLALLRKHEMSLDYFHFVLHRGFMLLKKANLNPNPFALACLYLSNFALHYSLPKWVTQSALEELLLKNPIPDYEEIISWSKWRLVIDGKEYAPVHASYEKWKEFYND